MSLRHSEENRFPNMTTMSRHLKDLNPKVFTFCAKWSLSFKIRF